MVISSFTTNLFLEGIEMPLVIVYGLRKTEFHHKNVEQIEEVLTGAILSVKELELTKRDISFCFVNDPTVISDNVDLIIVVDSLFDKPKRTFEVRRRLAEIIASEFKEKVTGNHARKIEVFIKRFNPEQDGFACILP